MHRHRPRQEDHWTAKAVDPALAATDGTEVAVGVLATRHRRDPDRSRTPSDGPPRIVVRDHALTWPGLASPLQKAAEATAIAQLVKADAAACSFATAGLFWRPKMQNPFDESCLLDGEPTTAINLPEPLRPAGVSSTFPGQAGAHPPDPHRGVRTAC